MKFLKSFEDITNSDIQIKVLTEDELSNLYRKLYQKVNGGSKINLKDKIHYFDYHDLSSWGGSEKHRNSLVFITAYNDKDILGICKFAYWDSGKNYSVSYLSTNNDYFQLGISKKLMEELFKYFSKKYPNETLNWSGYSVDGWKYLRKSILEMSKKYNVKILEKSIEYVTKWSDENRKLYDKSKKIIKKEYPSKYSDYGN